MQITWETYNEELRQFVGRRVNNAMDADDVLQDVLLKAYRQQHQLDDPTRIRAWIYQIARNTIIDYYRSKRAPYVLLDDWSDVIPAPIDDDKTNAEIIACVLSVVEDLPEKYRTALVAADLYEIPQNLLSHQLGVSYSGMKSRVQRGREKLRQMLEQRCRVEVSQYRDLNHSPRTKVCCG